MEESGATNLFGVLINEIKKCPNGSQYQFFTPRRENAIKILFKDNNTEKWASSHQKIMLRLNEVTYSDESRKKK